MGLKRVSAALAAVITAAAFAGCGASEIKSRGRTAETDSVTETSETVQEAEKSSETAEDSSETESSEGEKTSSEKFKKENSSDEQSNFEDTDFGSEVARDELVYRIDENGDMILQGELKGSLFDAGAFTMEFDSSSWTYGDMPEDPVVRTAYFSYSDEWSGVSLTAKRLENAADGSLEEMKSRTISDLSTMDCDSIGARETSVGGEPAYIVTGSATITEDFRLGMMYVLCVHGDLELSFVFSGGGEGVDGAEEALAAAVQTLEFKE